MAYTINQIKPAHIVYINTPRTQSGLLISETIELSQRIFHYKLGAWGLGVQPFATEQSQGVIKMPNTPSVQPALLSGVAGFVSGDVASARINGAISITQLEKTVEENTLTITYTVAQSQTDAITQAELLDAEGNVLTSSVVYVPVTGSTIMKHIIPVSEGAVNNGN